MLETLITPAAVCLSVASKMSGGIPQMILNGARSRTDVRAASAIATPCAAARAIFSRSDFFEGAMGALLIFNVVVPMLWASCQGWRTGLCQRIPLRLCNMS
jgi:hypothetical protein